MSSEDRAAKLAERGRVTPKQLAHVVRRTSRFAEMVRWYEAVLAAEVVHSDDFLAFLTYDDEHHRIAIAQLPGLEDQPPLAAGTDHIAFAYADLGDLLYTFERLRRVGIEPFWCINHGPTTSMYYKDPDGNKVELQVDNFPSTEETNRWMRSGEFAANPIGVVFDPDDLAARYRAGEPIAALVVRPPLPEGATAFDMLRF
ncbi:MAG: biphenyl 2,3-dioxygenase [Deltaproteobacteria bacterium]|nr:MAG: biphenyl 2,3-dioxygenase [Deltaproteobacteria bacterium]